MLLLPYIINRIKTEYCTVTGTVCDIEESVIDTAYRDAVRAHSSASIEDIMASIITNLRNQSATQTA